jgi:hypothetical protein
MSRGRVDGRRAEDKMEWMAIFMEV